MTWTFEHVPDLDIIEVKFAGDITARDLQECTSRLIALQKSDGHNRYLVDTHEMQLNASLLDVYDLPTHQYVVEQADRDETKLGSPLQQLDELRTGASSPENDRRLPP